MIDGLIDDDDDGDDDVESIFREHYPSVEASSMRYEKGYEMCDVGRPSP